MRDVLSVIGKRMCGQCFFAALFLLCSTAAAAQETPLADAAQEARAQALFYQIRCVVCAGEPVAESPADVARIIRAYVRSRIQAGATDDAIRAELAASYGQSILLTPRFDAATALLWLAPVLLLAAGGVVIALRQRATSNRAGSAG